MPEPVSNRKIRIEKNAVGSTLVSGDSNTIYVIQQATEQRNEQDQVGTVGPNPYKGLASFKEEDSEHYFGREAQAKRLCQRFQALYEQSVQKKSGTRFLPILGPSGCGKSSLVRAGLIPELAKQPLLGKEKFQMAVLVPGNRPLEALAGVLAKLATNDPVPVEKTEEFERVLSNDTSTYDGLRRIASSLSNIIDVPLVVLVDQFEEVYSLCQDINQRRIFIDTLLHAASDPSGNVSVLITLRSDFWGETQEHEQLNQIIGSDQSVNVPAMTKTELRRAIAKPAKQEGYLFNDAIIDLLIQDTEGREGALPLLQFTLSQIWDGLNAGTSPPETYREIGGVGGALAGRAQNIYEQLTNNEQEIARRVFVGLVQLGEGTRDTRRRVALENLVTSRDNLDSVKRLINRFSSPGVRLVTLSNEANKEIVEVTHEALFDQWQLLNDWLNSSRDDIRFQRRLEAAATYWQQQGKPHGLLWRSPDLDLLRTFEQKDRSEMSERSLAFFEASDRDDKREKQIKLWSVTGLSSLLLVTTGLAGLSFVQSIDQKRATKLAERQALNSDLFAQSLAAETLLASNLDIDALIASVSLGEKVKESQSLLDPSTQMRAIVALRQVVYGVSEHNRLQGHDDGVWSLSFSPDGKTLASASADGTVKIWGPNGALLKTLEGHGQWGSSVSFSPDGKTLASAGSDGTIKLWNPDGALLKTLTGHKHKIWDVSFSPDSQTLASASIDNTVKIWSLDGHLLKTLEGHTDGVMSVSFSPDGKTLASASSDGTVKLWSPNGALLKTLGRDEDNATTRVDSVSFSPDGKTLASAGSGDSDDGTIKLWSLDGALPKTLEGHTDVITSVSFSPDGQILASAGSDHTVKLWSSYGSLLKTLEGHGHWIWSVSFSPDGKTLASADVNGTVKLWTIGGVLPEILEGHSDRVKSVSFSPDGEIIASASDDNTVKLWSHDGVLLKTLEGHSERVDSVSFSPDGEIIASASDDNTVKLWSHGGVLLKTLKGHDGAVNSTSFSPDGKNIISASDDKIVKLWNLDGDLLETLQDHENKASSISFSSDGQTFAFAGNDNTVELRNMDSNLSKTLEGHGGTVTSISFSPDGRTIASASYDNTVKLWSLDGYLLKTLEGHSDSTWSISFSPDGNTLASASSDGTVILWNLDLDNLLVRGCEWLQDYLTTNPMLTNEEEQLCDIIRHQGNSNE